MKSIRETVQVVGLVGNPVTHSLSPLMHTTALEHLGIPWEYHAFPAQSAQEAEHLFEEVKSGVFAGLNVTTPYKQTAFSFCDSVSLAASVATGVNTLHISDSELSGDNTDGLGIVSSLTSDGGLDPEGARVLILGTGPTALAGAWELGSAGASEVLIMSRDLARSREVVARLGTSLAANADRRGVASDPVYKALSYQTLAEDLGADSTAAAHEYLAALDAIVNATTVGMRADDPSPVPEECFSDTVVALDLVYGTYEPTSFFYGANARGAKALDGRGVLVAQGAASLAIWTGLTFDRMPLDLMREVVDRELADRLRNAHR